MVVMQTFEVFTPDLLKVFEKETFVEFKTTSNMACIGRRKNVYSATLIKNE